MKVYNNMKTNAFILITVFVAHFFLSHAFGKEHINTTPIISRYSIKGRAINFNNEVGEIQVSSNKGASGVTTVKFGSKLYFLKDKADEDGLRQALDSIIATRILNRINNDYYRFPNLTLGYDDSDDELISFKVFSEGLIKFKSLNDMNRVEISGLNLKDLENLFIGLVLIGGGDPMETIYFILLSLIFSQILILMFHLRNIFQETNKQRKKKYQIIILGQSNLISLFETLTALFLIVIF